MWKRPDSEEPQQSRPAAATPAPASFPTAAAAAPGPGAGGSRHGGAVIGPSIRLRGDLNGEEDLLIQGQVEGKIDLQRNNVTVGKQGRVKADIQGRMIDVEGQVEGNLIGGEQVVIRTSGSVRGNITAPRVSLEDGANFKGAIDMEPQRGKERPAAAGAAAGKQAPEARAAADVGSAGRGEAVHA